ncbi:DUF2779 domain-containing protein [Rhodohalobacter mucosus]|uniref:DUF2779 domain-containing protein n=1 Tax=Rhodohalobacter mucosus TaxID=2079485 RepID=A0A316TPB4_9BACT|nr:DUF2779 domain-containing protein [Rhodohalobacter mucosus]PWN06240.1 hypothetical protein DDZ15_10450 [Rhodohalobacter mucosus]
MRIYDNTFQQAISCPLKMYHVASKSGGSNSKVAFRHRNKLLLRDVISLQFNNRRFTSDSLSEAEKETSEWLQEDSVTICGAVLRKGIFVTRIPILVKEKDNYTIIQVHGKLRKRSEHDEVQFPVRSRSMANYLLKAAYRSFVLNECMHASSLHTTLCFPNKAYRSTDANLFQSLSRIRENSDTSDLAEQTEELFVTVDATKAVNNVGNAIPELVSHRTFTGMSVKESCKFIEDTPLEDGNILDIGIHRECKYCDFRRMPAGKGDGDGCWRLFFPNHSVVFPDLHVYELIGHGNDTETANGFYYQEQVPASEPFSSFGNIEKLSGEKFTIHKRRMLQLLKSKEVRLPSLWARAGIRELNRLNYPLHFLDFEAATFALPLERGEHPYQPVYFQFSCHTLHKNGTIHHHDWLDLDPERTDVHVSLIEKLSSVPGIEEGTVIQYSQFEYRAMKNILKRFKKNAMRYEAGIDALEQLMRGAGSGNPSRFLDLSRVIEEYYYNCYMNEGIGLKHVLKSILNWQKHEGSDTEKNVKIHDVNIDLFEAHSPDGQPDPYLSLSENDERIGDGSEAMNAWLSLKSGLLGSEEMNVIPALLRRYCALDSYALVILFRHLRSCSVQVKGDKDLIIFK